MQVSHWYFWRGREVSTPPPIPRSEVFQSETKMGMFHIKSQQKVWQSIRLMGTKIIGSSIQGKIWKGATWKNIAEKAAVFSSFCWCRTNQGFVQSLSSDWVFYSTVTEWRFTYSAVTELFRWNLYGFRHNSIRRYSLQPHSPHKDSGM